ncbi:DUF6801 domain-containing protein, partial [Janibacter limosus]|uniref:DUF6801 domain-containing protein n=1 Tax=Janibacter limosus TaxID=53458 RepID=UPI000A997D2A
RLSAGAALVTGLGMMGLATAVPAQAATVTQNYECSFDVLNVGVTYDAAPVQVELTADVPATVEVGDEINSAVTATVTIQDEQRNALYGLLGVRAVDGPDAAGAAAEDGGLNTKNARNQASFTLSNGTDSAEGIIPLEVPVTAVPDSGELVVVATGAVAPISADGVGTYTVDAGDFQAYIRGYENADGTGYKTNITMDCTNVSEITEIATVEVTEATDEPTDPDPSGTPTDEPTDPSGTSTDEPTDPSTTPEPSATVGDGDDGSTDPQTPGVVQTDDASVLSGDDNAALLLGGVLLAGAGAGAVTIARRRSGSQH